ncbi:hypothetical protein BGX23_011428 [Mortierella sp. AD031]|nr:hypothetical protein BGX23_011428 [Mortierella sp. AD031]
MGYIALRRMRKWLLFLTTINFLGTIGWYGYIIYLISNSSSSLSSLQWEDWVLIASSIIFFGTYLYSVRSESPTGIHKLLRAFLLLIPTGLVLYIRLHYIVLMLQLFERTPEYFVGRRPFGCGDWSCYLENTLVFYNTIVALFVLVEIGMALAWGHTSHQFQFGAHGYVDSTGTGGGNEVVLGGSPDHPQPQAYYSQMQQLQPQQQRTSYYPHAQQPILLDQQQQQHSPYKIDNNVQPQYLYQQPQYPTLPQQQQPPPSPSLPPPPRQPSPGYVPQALQYEILQQQQLQQQQQQQWQRQSFSQPANYVSYSGSGY